MSESITDGSNNLMSKTELISGHMVMRSRVSPLDGAAKQVHVCLISLVWVQFGPFGPLGSI